MAIANGYATLVEQKAYLDITTTAQDTVLEYAIESASRAIDKFTRRRFWKNSSAEVRVFTAEYGDLVVVDDLVSITALTTDEDGDRTYERTWATTDYDLYPYNATDEDPDEPYTELHINSHTGLYTFPVGIPQGVKINGVFGWPAVPTDIRQACLIMSSRLHHRKDSPFGTTGNPELGEMTIRRDPDLKDLLTPYRRMSVGAV